MPLPWETAVPWKRFPWEEDEEEDQIPRLPTLQVPPPRSQDGERGGPWGAGADIVEGGLRSLGRGFAGLGTLVGQGLEVESELKRKLAGAVLPEGLEKYTDAVYGQGERAGRRAADYWSEQGATVDPYTAEGSMLDKIKREPLKAIPKFALAEAPAMAVTGLATAVNPAAGVAVGASRVGLPAMLEGKDEGVSFTRRAATAAPQAVVSGALESLPWVKYLGKGSKGLLRELTESAGTEAVTELTQGLNDLWWSTVRTGKKPTQAEWDDIVAQTILGGAMGPAARGAGMTINATRQAQPSDEPTSQYMRVTPQGSISIPDLPTPVGGSIADVTPDPVTESVTAEQVARAAFGEGEQFRRVVPPHVKDALDAAAPRLAELRGTPADIGAEVALAAASHVARIDPSTLDPVSQKLWQTMEDFPSKPEEVTRILHRYSELAAQNPGAERTELLQAAIDTKNQAGEIKPMVEKIDPIAQIEEGGFLRFPKGDPGVPGTVDVWKTRLFTPWGKFALAGGRIAKMMGQADVAAQRGYHAEMKVATNNATNFGRAFNRWMKDAERAGAPLDSEGALAYVTEGLESWNNLQTWGDRPIPEDVREAALRFRQQIDSASDKLLSSDAIQGALREAIVANKGMYLRRTYRANRDPDAQLRFLKETPEGQRQWDAAMEWAKNEFPRAEPVQLENMLTSWVRRLGPDATRGVRQNTGIPGLDQSIFKRRKLLESEAARHPSSTLYSEDPQAELLTREVLPKELEDLYGLDKDPVVRALDGLSRVAFDYHVQRMTEEVLAGLKAEGLVGMTRDSRPIGVNVGALSGVHVPSHIADVIEAQWTARTSQWHDLAKVPFAALTKASSMTKAGLTVYNPGGQVRNALAWTAIDLANGDFIRPYKGFRDVVTTVGADVFSLDLESPLGKFAQKQGFKTREDLLRLGTELGVFGESVGREVDYETQSRDLRSLGNAADEIALFKAAPMVRGLKKASRIAHGLYQGGDDQGKGRRWLAEMEKLYWAKGLDPANPEHMRQVARDAAKKVERITPTHSNAPGWVNAMSKNPLLADFVTWSYEMARSAYVGTPTVAIQELREAKRTGNWKLAKLGAQRLAGAGLVNAGMLAIPAALRGMAGVDEEDEKAARLLLPAFMQDSTIFWLDNDKGKFSVINGGYTLPHEVGAKVVRAGMKAASQEDAAVEQWRAAAEGAIESAFEPYVGMSILVQESLEVAQNRKAGSRRQVYPENPDGKRSPEFFIKQQLPAISEHLYRGLAPRYLSQVERLVRATHGTPLASQNRYGTEYRMTAEGLAALGLKPFNGDWTQQWAGTAAAFSETRNNIQTHYNDETIRNANATLESIQEEKKQRDQAHRALWEITQQRLQAARRLLQSGGYSEATTYRKLLDKARNTVGVNNFNAMWEGRYVPPKS